MFVIAGVVGRDTAVEGRRSVPRPGRDAVVGEGDGAQVVGKDQLESEAPYWEGSVSQEDCEPMRGA